MGPKLKRSNLFMQFPLIFYCSPLKVGSLGPSKNNAAPTRHGDDRKEDQERIYVLHTARDSASDINSLLSQRGRIFNNKVFLNLYKDCQFF